MFSSALPEGMHSPVVQVPVQSGNSFQVASPPGSALVTPGLAEELERVLERFAREVDCRGSRKIGVFFRPGIFGHHKVGRAADIYAVDGIGIDIWKGRWDEAQNRAALAADAEEKSRVLNDERSRNLGWRIYKALQIYGRWSQPYGYPVQLFGPWTRSEGPWKYISDFLLNAHRDHIHVAK
jgi:hypothetical protein